ncbi:putative MULE transposase domain-containing protein [Helianthus annuus]|nr:putative MULE transposase domain-containing protein [Helianthus annuus]KAJ0516868.1 putative MULE transposase domain-containing protein [Helianthus annuus]KAJ0684873.1 putative MULE transposase domain-containing protein [Helianthus annuus]KAJ0688799.1 putative MULE transposase domain-containing protein [Helianthus annuus]
MLTAVGLDPNNGIYRLAYDIVDVETKTKDCWTWFLQCIQDDLELPSNANFIIIFDRQKGIMPAIIQAFLAAEHRYCLRYIHQNMKLQWRGMAFKHFLRNAASATIVPEFDEKMEEFKKYNLKAYKWLKDIPPQHWARSYFTGKYCTFDFIHNIQF